MDIRKLGTRKADEGVAFTPQHPVTGEPLTYVDGEGVTKPVSITTLGISGQIAQKHLREQQNRRIRKAVASSGAITAEEMDAAELSLLAKLTTAWEGIEDGDEPIPFSETAARKLYEELPWLRAQVKAHIDNTALFVGN